MSAVVGTWRKVEGVIRSELVGEAMDVSFRLTCGHEKRGLVPADKVHETTELPCRRCLEGSEVSGTTCRRCKGSGRILWRGLVRAWVEPCPRCKGEGAVTKGAHA